MSNPQQVELTDVEAGLPPYLESFLAHLRLLVGVPFDYLVPDARLLPNESIRFFYLDRSWTDRLVDGAMAVGKIGSREQAHHQAHAPSVNQQLDLSERIVRDLQRQRGPFADLKDTNDTKPVVPADVVTGFLMRSQAVRGWPHMDVRAYDTDLAEPLDPKSDTAIAHQLKTLRLELLSPSVMLALFQGVPQLVLLEEPHHGVQFGVEPADSGYQIPLRSPEGHTVPFVGDPGTVAVPFRAAQPRTIAVAELRRRLADQATTYPTPPDQMPKQTGSASFAVEALQPPWRQRFEGTTDEGLVTAGGAFTAPIAVAHRVADSRTIEAINSLARAHGR